MTKLDKAGTYDVVVFLDSPRIVHCFSLPVLPDPKKGEQLVATLKHLTKKREFAVGEQQTIAVRLEDSQGKGLAGLKDVVMVLHMAGGRWFDRVRARDRGDGIYSVDVRVPLAGNIQTHVQCKSAGLTFADAPMLSLKAIRQTKTVTANLSGGPQK